MKIPRKLGLSFLTINASAAVVMLVFLASIMMIARTTERNNHSQDIYAKALTLETAILRQNSQFRGFLVTGDPSYLKSYEEARVEFDATAVELATMLTVASVVRPMTPAPSSSTSRWIAVAGGTSRGASTRWMRTPDEAAVVVTVATSNESGTTSPGN